MAEPGVVGHDREHVQILRLGFQIDRELLSQGAVDVGFRPGAMERAQQGCRGVRWSMISPEFAHPVGEDVATPLHPGGSVTIRGSAWRGLAWVRLGARFRVSLLKERKATITETGIRQVGLGLLPVCMGMMIVEPDAVDRCGGKNLAEGLHSIAAIAGMRRANALPTVGRG